MEKLKKILDSETNKWIVKKAKPQVFGIIIMSVIFGGMAYLGVAVATLSRGIVDSAVNSDVGGIVYFAIILISLTIAQLVIRIISKVLTFNVSSKLEISIKQDIFDNIIRKKYNEISSIHTGELLNRITSDVSVLVSSIISIVPNMVYFIVKLVGVFVVLFAIDKTFSLVFVFGGALMFVVVLLFKSKMKTLHKAVQESDGKTRSFFQEIFSSLLVVKVFGAENKVSENAMNLQHNNFKIKRKRNYISIVATTGFSFIFALGYMYALIWGAFAISDHTITYGVLTSMLALVSQIQGPVRGISSILPSYYSALASAERLMDIENLDNEDVVNNSAIDTEKLYDKTEKIVFDNITFSYGRENVLENTSLVLKKGDFALLAGISGIGKSTLLKTLMGIIPPLSGSFAFHIAARPAYLEQDLKFREQDTNAFNYISDCFPRFNQKEIRSQLARVGIKGEMSLQNVKTMSGGEQVRIRLLTIMNVTSNILILDEPTNHLDVNAKESLQKAIADYEGAVILVSHDKTFAESVCDKTLTLKQL